MSHPLDTAYLNRLRLVKANRATAPAWAGVGLTLPAAAACRLPYLCPTWSFLMTLRSSVDAGLFLAAALLSTVALAAQEQTLQIDPAKSDIQFTLEDPLHAVHGTFHVQSGSVRFAKEGRMSGTVAVDAGSGDSGNGSRDKKMRNDELKAPTFSTVTFAPKRYTGALAASGDSNITVDGTFTLLGTPHEISVPMQVHLSDRACKATGTFDIPYVQWGMKDPSNFLLKVGKVVTVNLTLVGPVSAGHFD